MKRWKFAAFLSFVLFFFGCASTRVQTSLHQRPVGFWTNRQAVVQVMHIYWALATDKEGKPILDGKGKFTTSMQGGLGTAGVVDVNGLVLTNYHIVVNHPIKLNDKLVPDDQLSSPMAESYGVCVVTAGKRECVKAEVVAADPLHDLALLRADRRFPLAVEFADDNELVVGDEIYFWGNVFHFLPPSPFSGHYTGTVEPPYYEGENFSTRLPLVFMDINVSPGSSGSPVFNEVGKVIGVACAFTPPGMGGRSLGIAIPSSVAMKLLKQYRARLKK